ncbi:MULTISPECIES: hypothetical protein [Cellvibrio]|uniref:Uncharacterized protein n=1 Tax=Cellvibrio fibrivorans TaxID=126350 RepID=A0ABU1V1G3_9GAMM|nr:hypothetical protein [Cellvibrio fibrivorans]MDR7091293.1 hypothetical protein [Cellvibrio fibrivorans]
MNLGFNKVKAALVLGSLLSFSSYSFGEQTVAKCENWTLSTTFEWAGCKWNADGGWADQTKESLLDSLKKSAGEKVKAVALNYLASVIPGGSFLAAFGDKSGPSELQLAVNQILDAIKVSQEKVVQEVNKILITRDFASLDAFKLRVRSYMLYSETVKKNNLYELQNLWNTSVELRNLFETHTNLLGAGETIDSLQAYMAIVSLEIMLRSQLTVYNYSISGEPERIGPALTNHYQEELAEVFLHMNNIDWVKGAEAFERNKKETVWNVGNKLGGCAIGKLYEFDYLNEHFTIRNVCSIKTGQCETDFPQGDFTKLGITPKLYSYTSTYKASDCTPDNASQMPLNDGSNSYSGRAMVNTAAENIARKFIGDVYKSSYTILDQWWEMAKFGGMRPRNYADRVLIQYYADKMFVANGYYNVASSTGGGLIYTDGYGVFVGASDGSSASAQWIFERNGEFFTIKSRLNQLFLQLKNGVIVLAAMPADNSFAYWKLTDVDGNLKFRNKNQYDISLNDAGNTVSAIRTTIHTVEASGWKLTKKSSPAPAAPQYAYYGSTGCPSYANCPGYFVGWPASEGATYYNWRATVSGSIARVTTTSTTSYSSPSSSGGVQACNESGCSAWVNFGTR